MAGSSRQVVRATAVALLVVATQAATTSRILGESHNAKRSEAQTRQQVGDGPGRPLYNFYEVELPDAAAAGSSRGCIALSMELATGSLNVRQRNMSSAEFTKSAAANSDYIAGGCFDDALASTGWTNLQISTTNDVSVPLAVRAYGAGVVEGLLTFKEIGAFNKTVRVLLEKDAASGAKSDAAGGSHAAVDRVVRMALIAWEEMSGGDASKEPKDDVARQAWAALIQMRGIRDGYNLIAEGKSTPSVSMYQVMLMNMHAEIPAIVDLYSRSEQANVMNSFLQTSSHTSRARGVSGRQSVPSTQALEEDVESDRKTQRTLSWKRWASHMPKGSALVRRIGPDGTPEDMVAGHVTFGNYGEMLRVMKTYTINFGTSVGSVTMSSYPGCISSTDDYFITDTGFVLMSTNLWVPREGEYARPATTNEGLPSFLRATVATRLAVHPREWAKVYSFLTGIAGAKQWLIVDYSKFKGNQPITNETLFLVESMPRLARMGDVSMNLRRNGFFEAHGTPHFRQIREKFGLPGLGEGTYKEHLGSALLDKAATVDSLAMARSVLSEILPARTSLGSGIHQIPVTTRNDKNVGKASPIPEGGIDAKVTSRCLVKNQQLQAISGPPSDGEHAAFDWEAFSASDWPRFGLPRVWNFTWVNIGVNGVSQPVDDSLATCESPDIDSGGSAATSAHESGQSPSVGLVDLSSGRSLN